MLQSATAQKPIKITTRIAWQRPDLAGHPLSKCRALKLDELVEQGFIGTESLVTVRMHFCLRRTCCPGPAANSLSKFALQ